VCSDEAAARNKENGGYMPRTVERDFVSEAYRRLRERYSLTDIANLTLSELVDAITGELQRLEHEVNGNGHERKPETI
jgi:hypothetical protein